MECALLAVPATQDQEKKSPRQFRSIKEEEERHTHKKFTKNIIKFSETKIKRKVNLENRNGKIGKCFDYNLIYFELYK